MIRRISANNDYRDIVRSCPSGVIDDIYAIEYYVKGYDGVYSAAFSKTGSLLEVILPSSALQTFHSGMLMRRAKYRNADSSFPDQYYDLEFVEDMDVWLENDGVEPGPGPEPGEYVTEEELAETLEDYVTDEEFEIAQRAIGALDTRIDGVISSLSDYATKQFVGQAVDYLEGEIQGVARNVNSIDIRVTALEQSTGGVTQEQFQNHIASNDVQFHNINESIDALENAGFITQQDLDSVADSLGQDIQAVQDQVDDIDLIVGDLSDSVSDLDQRVTDLEQGGGGGGGTWGSITGDIQDQQDLMIEFEVDRSRLDDLENGTVVPTGTATESWVQNQGYITSSDLSGYATETWVQNQGYLTQHQDLTGYATQTWVQNQGYLTSSSTLPANQITCNISGDVFDFDDVDEGLTALVSKVEEQMDDITSLDTRVTDLENAGYITSSALSGYATESWATNQFLEESKVWSGTETQWNQLSAAQKASYTIALITQ